jgi:DNA repair exonuclease SbcCD ATPase subunit
MSSANALRAPQRDDAYTRLAELAAREAEINCNEAARRREWREAARTHRVSHSVAIRLAEPPPQAQQAGEPEVTQSEAVAPARRADVDFIDARLAELEERERTLADREKLIATLETLLDRSRQRLEEQLEQLAQRQATLKPTPRLEAARPPSGAIEFVGSYPIRDGLVTASTG